MGEGEGGRAGGRAVGYRVPPGNRIFIPGSGCSSSCMHALLLDRRWCAQGAIDGGAAQANDPETIRRSSMEYGCWRTPLLAASGELVEIRVESTRKRRAVLVARSPARNAMSPFEGHGCMFFCC